VSIEDAITKFLDGQRVDRAAFAVAAPIVGDSVSFTNSSWTFSKAALQKRFGWDELALVNDFAANALAIPYLEERDFVSIGGGFAVEGKPIGVIGPGTGLGVSALIPLPGGAYMAIESEGGHITMPACNDREVPLLAFIRSEFGHVSAERVVSGGGLVNLYRAIQHRDGQALPSLTPDLIVSKALDGSCKVCDEALDTFFCMLGCVAGNLALTLGAKGGIVLAGGILPRVRQALEASQFRERFEAKGRFNDWLGSIPTRLCLHPDPAVIGLAHLI
jgi:glucokinase